MSDTYWTRIRAPFPPEAETWGVASLDPEHEEAVLSPQLAPGAIAARLDEVMGPDGWSVRHHAVERAVTCTLEIGAVARSAVVDVPELGGSSFERAADLALARAAALFGMVAGGDGERRAPYDPETGDVLVEDADAVDGGHAAPADATGADPELDLAEAAAEARGVPAEGQRMIDRLVERLKDEGQGLPAARLLVRYGGYGKDPAAARELYRELRALLVRTGAPTDAKG